MNSSRHHDIWSLCVHFHDGRDKRGCTRWVANAASPTTTSDQIVERLSRLDVLFEPTGRDSKARHLSHAAGPCTYARRAER